jgi:hypothetical protein
LEKKGIYCFGKKGIYCFGKKRYILLWKKVYIKIIYCTSMYNILTDEFVI